MTNITWNGNLGHNWFVGGNWSSVVVPPASGDIATIAGAGSPYVEIASSGATALSVMLQNGNTLFVRNTGSLALGNTLILGGIAGQSTVQIDAGGTLSTTTAFVGFSTGGTALVDVNGGVFNSPSVLYVSGVSNGSAGTLKIENGGIVNAGGGVIAGVSGAGAVDGTVVLTGLGGSLNAPTLNLATSGSVFVTQTTNNTSFTGAITGAGHVVISNGPGAVTTLSGANTYTGSTAILAGTLVVQNTSTTSKIGSLGTGTVSVGTGTLLKFVNSDTINDDYVISNIISGGGVVDFAGPNGSITTISGNNIYTDRTVIESGIVNVDFTSASPFGTSAVTMTGGALRATGAGVTLANDFTLRGVIGFGSSTNISGNIALAGTTSITPSINAGNSTWNGSVALTASDLIFADAGPNTAGGSWTGESFTITGTISGSGRIFQSDSGKLILAGANTFSGATFVQSGVLNIQNASALGSALSGTTVSAGASLEIQGQVGTIAEGLTLSGSGVAGAGALRNISGLNTFSAPIVLANDASINSDSGVLVLAGGISGSGKNLTFGGVGGIAVESNIATDTGTLTKDGSGEVLLIGSNSYSGITTINGGTLSVSGGSAISDSGAVAVNATGELHLGNSEAIGSLAGAGTVFAELVTALTVGGANTDTDFSGNIASDGDFIKIGTGTQTLSGVNTSAGVTTVSGGVLDITGSIASLAVTASGSGSLHVDGSSLEDTAAVTLNNSGNLTLTGSETIGSLASGSSTSTVALGNNLLTLGGNNATTTFAGIISGAGDLLKTGTGSLTLSGANTFTGITVVQGGALLVSNADALGNSLQISGVSSSVNLLGNNVSINNFIVSAGSNLSNGSLTVSNPSNAGMQLFGGSTISANLAGAAGMTVGGTGINTVTGANTYTGLTTIATGSTLKGGATSSFSAVSAMNDNGTLDLGGFNQTIKSLSGIGTVNLTGHGLSIASQAGSLGSVSFKGAAGVDALSITLDATAGALSLASTNFTTWTDGTDTITVTGNALNNSLMGSSHVDTLNGGGGSDFLDGKAGSDFIFGGDGNDTIVYDAADLASNINGGNDFDTLQVNGGAVPISFNLAASSFERAVWVLNDTGANPWSSMVNTYDSGWHLLQASTYYDDNSHIDIFYDVAAATNYQSLRNDFNIANALTASYYLFDDNTRSEIFYDTTGLNYQNVRNDYNVSNQLSATYYLMDDGTKSNIFYNPPGYLQTRADYDSLNRLTYTSYKLTDGTLIQTYFDAADAFNYISSRSDTDAAGHLTFVSTVYNNNMRDDVYYDVANTQPWNTATYHYDAALNLLSITYT